jgi:DNA-binding GntR family transcriptional regulator
LWSISSIDEAPAAIAGLEIDRSSTSTRVADALRRMIVNGELAPGTPLREVPLSQSTGVSRNTVREAFRILATEGLTTHNLHRGVMVAQLTVDDAKDIFRVRRLLELSGVVEACKASDEERLPLHEALEGYDAGVESGDRSEVIRFDLLFHERIVAFLRSKRVDRLIQNTLAEVRLALSAVDRMDESIRSREPHSAILAEIEARHPEEASRLLTRHLDDSEEVVLNLLKTSGEASAN